jgi:hypothetical protein
MVPAIEQHGPIEAWIIDDTAFQRHVESGIMLHARLSMMLGGGPMPDSVWHHCSNKRRTYSKSQLYRWHPMPQNVEPEGSDDGAGAPDEIDVTPAMIEAGLSHLLGFHPSRSNDEDVVTNMYRAMHLAFLLGQCPH